MMPNTHDSKRRAQTTGFTLIEIIIVVCLMAVIMTIAAFGFGLVGRADVNGEALRISSAIRYTFNMAATSNKTLQMKLDFDSKKNGISVEELTLTGGLSRDEMHGITAKSKDDIAWNRNAKSAASLDQEDTKFGKVSRTQLDDVFLSGDDAFLKDGVYFIGLMTSHHDEIQTEGIGTINFFANGFVERSVIFLGDENAKNGIEPAVIYTITVSPLTGNSSVQAGRIEINSSFFEEEEDD